MNAIPDTYTLGMIGVVIGVFALLAFLTILEIWYELHGQPSVGYRIQTWSDENKWLAAVLLLVLGALLAHFTLNPWPPLKPCLC